VTRGWMGARSEFDAGDEDPAEYVVMFVCMKCGAEVWQPLTAPRVCDHCGYQLVANPRRG
jgi:DNA-directed RNA polymerase subunit RPC12/RpoP